MEDMSLSYIGEQLYKLNENIVDLHRMLERKFGGLDDNLNVTLYTDEPIKVIKSGEEKDIEKQIYKLNEEK